MDYKKLLGKKVEVVKNTKRKQTRHIGILTDFSGHYVCIKNSNNKDIWLWKPIGNNGYIRELKENLEV